MNSVYTAFLVRFQISQGQKDWRIMLKNVESGEILHFGSAEEGLRYMLNYLAIHKPDQDDQNDVEKR